MRVALALPECVEYPQGGGLWTLYLQYLFGLRDLGHDVYCLTVTGHRAEKGPNENAIGVFLRRMERLGFGGHAAVLSCPAEKAEPGLDDVTVFGMSAGELEELERSADVLWNFAGCLRMPVRWLFRRTVLFDGDPGHLQVCACMGADRVEAHTKYLTVGLNMNGEGCEAPKLGLPWEPVPPAILMRMWRETPDPGPEAPFTSVTHWTWEELWFRGRVLGVAKRNGYLEYADLPKRVKGRFALAARIYYEDREQLLNCGWGLADPYEVASTPGRYRAYIRNSRAEFACPKRIHVQMQTGWFSDRSACYLASGRPVLCEDNGFSRHLPSGQGLVAFRNFEEAVEGANAIAADYPRHQRAARELAEEWFDTRKVLPRMLAAS